MVRDRGLIEPEPGGEIADADFLRCPRQGSQDRDPSRIGEDLEERGLGVQVGVVHRRFRATPLYRHSSILHVESKPVNIRGKSVRLAKTHVPRRHARGRRHPPATVLTRSPRFECASYSTSRKIANTRRNAAKSSSPRSPKRDCRRATRNSRPRCIRARPFEVIRRRTKRRSPESVQRSASP